MWFVFGGVTLLLAAIVGFGWRMAARWRGEERRWKGRLAWTQEIKGKHGPRGYRAGVPCPDVFRFSLHDEGALDRWFRRIGIDRERRVGDAAFDDAVFIDSDDDRVVAALRGSEELRQAILAQRARYPRSITRLSWRACRGRLWVEAIGACGRPGDEELGTLLDTLQGFADALAAQATRPGGDRFVWRAALVLATSTALALVGGAFAFVAFMEPPAVLEPWRAFGLSLLVSIPAALAFALASMAWLRPSARAHRVLAEVMTVGLGGIVALGWTGFQHANAALDRAPVEWQRHEQAWTETVRYRCGRRGGRTCLTYYVHLADGLRGPPPNPSSLEIDSQERDALPSSGAVEVGIGEGRFGLRWIAGVRRAPKWFDLSPEERAKLPTPAWLRDDDAEQGAR